MDRECRLLGRIRCAFSQSSGPWALSTFGVFAATPSLHFHAELCRPWYIPRGAGSLEEFDFCVYVLRLIQFILASSVSSLLPQDSCGAEHPLRPQQKASLVPAEHPLAGPGHI